MPKPKQPIFSLNQITSSTELIEFGSKLESDIEEYFGPLWTRLDKPVMSFDYGTLFEEMTYTSSYRRRLANCYALVVALRKRASGKSFLLPLHKGVVTTLDREAHQDEMEAPFEGLKILIEEQLKTLDMRVNECKKLMGIEGDGLNYGTSRKAA